MLLQKLVFVAQLGASVVLYLLIGLSILSIGLIFERWWFFRRRKLDLAKTADALEASLKARDVEQAVATLKKSKSIEAQGQAPEDRAARRRDAGGRRGNRRSFRCTPRRGRGLIMAGIMSSGAGLNVVEFDIP